MDSDKKKSGTEAATKEAASSDGEAAASSSGHGRAERQKPISKAYRDNWNLIFAKKKKKR